MHIVISHRANTPFILNFIFILFSKKSFLRVPRLTWFYWSVKFLLLAALICQICMSAIFLALLGLISCRGRLQLTSSNISFLSWKYCITGLIHWIGPVLNVAVIILGLSVLQHSKKSQQSISITDKILG